MARRARGCESSPDGALRVSEHGAAVRAGNDGGLLVRCGEDFPDQARPRGVSGRLKLSTMPLWARSTERWCGSAAVARALADRSHSAQYGRQQIGPQRCQIGEIECVTDVTAVPPGREQARAAQDSEVAGNLRG